MAQKTRKEFKPGQLIRIKLSNGRIEEAYKAGTAGSNASDVIDGAASER